MPISQHGAHGPIEITVTAPNGGETWRAGRTYTITWLTEGDVPAVDIALLRGGQVCAILADAVPNTGTFEWPCTRCGEDSLGYQIRVADAASGELDVSDSPFAVAILEQVCTIEVIEPAGDGTWVEGEIMHIAWEPHGGACGGVAMIELMQDLMPCSYVAEVTANDGSFDWTVRTCSPNPTGYRIRVTDLASGSWGESGGNLTILSAPPDPFRVTVLAPNGGEEWIEGLQYAITWDHTQTCGQSVDIELVNEDESLGAIASGVPNSGSYAWVAEPLQEIGTGYRIRVTDASTGAWDESDGEFSIRGSEHLHIVAPNGGEVCVEGETCPIRWQFVPGFGDAVDIDLLLDGAVCERIATGAANDGNYDWQAERHERREHGYAIRVTNTTSGASDQSDGVFSILPPCELTVTFPNGGEIWAVGEPYLIGWDQDGACGELVSIELLRAGVPCQVIAHGTPNTGTYMWTAEPCGVQTSGYTIRVTDLASGAADASDGAFSIHQACAIHVVEPRAGETFIEGSPVVITWLRTGSCDGPVRLDLLQAGAVCRTIAGSLPNSGSHVWTAERCGSLTAGYRVRITDLASGFAAESPGTFTIEGACALRLYQPNGGEAWIAGRVETIHWLRTGACAGQVVIELLRDGVPCETIASAAPNTGSFTWEARQVGGRSAGYRIRIKDPSSLASCQSYGPFSIQEPCTLELLWPNGGESLVSGQREFITWDASATCGGQVRIDLLRGDQICRTIVASTANDGSQAWDPQPCSEAGGDYRVVITDLVSLAADTSAAPFEIRTPVYLRFAAENGGWVVRTNDPQWAGRVQLEFDAPATHWVGAPAWLPGGGSALILDPDADETASFFPVLISGPSAHNGLEVDRQCNGVEVKLTGCSQSTANQLALSVSTNVSGLCLAALPVTADQRQMSAQFSQTCVQSSGALKIEVTFTDRDVWNRLYAVREVEYVFLGWPAP